MNSHSPVKKERHTDLAPRLMDLAPAQEHLVPTPHQPFDLKIPHWSSYASQGHVQDMAVDPMRGWLWLATWGGVLCWDPQAQRCIRHTSAHGLSGNATRCTTVDHGGVVWAGANQGGLSYLNLKEKQGWQSHPDLQGWKTRHLSPRHEGGIYVALEAADGRGALAEITTPDASMHILLEGDLAVKALDVLHIAKDGRVWLGNPWGLHCFNDGTVTSFEYPEIRGSMQVRAIAQSPDGWLWLGTQRGLYRFQEGQEQPFSQEKVWPRDIVSDLAVEPAIGNLWCLTAREVGRLYDEAWQPAFHLPPGQHHCLITVPHSFRQAHPTSKLNLPDGQVWLGSASGLYQLGLDSYEGAFRYTDEDAVSNAIQALWADAVGIWVGAVRGLYHFNGESWNNHSRGVSDLREVRALVSGQRDGQIWVGGWQGGLQRLQQNVRIPGQALSQPIVALARGQDGTMWAATLDTVYWQSPESHEWRPVAQPLRDHIDGAIVQVLCHQLAPDPGGGTESTLWAGTSRGLFYYRPDRDAWGCVETLRDHAVQALSVDPSTNFLWVGTSNGLYVEPDWQCQHEANITALAFNLEAERELWLGTTEGLEAWNLSSDTASTLEREIHHFTAVDSGLASDQVTALAMRVTSDQQEVWIGSPNGVSCYQVAKSK
jgi:ligand-binding sensor domain-containing protein